jgi:preprotein translocase subunit SecA
MLFKSCKKILNSFLKRFSSSEFFLKKANHMALEINKKEEFFIKMDDETLSNHTKILKYKIKNGASINDNEIIVETFAMVREASRRILKMRHFDVQLIGGLALHHGLIAEMRTGEGKTLTATLPAVLNALTGEPVHIVTVNDYLANRDSESMAKLYIFLGLTVGCLINGQNNKQRRKEYSNDIVYGTNNEFGFDYLRDNMEISLKDLVQRGLGYAIIDEADSVLIDEARTPLIISGPSEDNSEYYILSNKVAQTISKDGFEIDEKNHTSYITDAGYDEINKMLQADGVLRENENVFDPKFIPLVHHISQSLKAIHAFKLNHDYLVKNNKVMIVDEFTGRTMDGRRYSDGLHQALEAKEGVKVNGESHTIASTTFQNYFRLYKKISGMTGTAMTEKEEFSQIYRLNICCIPTNLPVIRDDKDDDIYATLQEKYEAVVKLIKECHAIQQPVLVGTVSIERSEIISDMLKKENIKHQVLNARYNEQEADIIAQAGMPSGITIATNMAGRGTDIKLGGNEELLAESMKISIEEAQKIVDANKDIVVKAGGLYVIGTERHESRRIDNQLRGRCGRQGDHGSSKFFLSLEDDLMRIFGTDRAKNLLRTLGLKNGESITHPWISGGIRKAQKKVEARNFEIRKGVLKYDDVLNSHRKVIFNYRNLVLHADNYEKIFMLIEQTYIKVNNQILSSVLINGNLNSFVDGVIFDSIKIQLKDVYNIDTISEVEKYLKNDTMHASQVLESINKKIKEILCNKFADLNDNEDYAIEKRIWLNIIDTLWKEHLLTMDYLKQVVNLRAFAQKDSFTEYCKEGYELFSILRTEIALELIKKLSHLSVIHQNNNIGSNDDAVTPKNVMPVSFI